MWERLINALVELIGKTSEYLEVSTELKRKELEASEAPERNKIGMEVPEHKPEEPEKLPEPPKQKNQPEPVKSSEDDEVWVDAKEAGKLLNCTASYVNGLARRGYIPARHRTIKRLEFPGMLFSEKSLWEVRWKGAINRGSTPKERRWRLIDLLSAPGVDPAYLKGTSLNAHQQRFCTAKQYGYLNTYVLMGVEYVNLDEAARFTKWWANNYRASEKNVYPNFHNPADTYCVHEWDLIWVLTRDYHAHIAPTQEQIDQFEAIVKDLPSMQVGGVRYYKADAIEKVERTRRMLSHLEPVNG